MTQAPNEPAQTSSFHFCADRFSPFLLLEFMNLFIFDRDVVYFYACSAPIYLKYAIQLQEYAKPEHAKKGFFVREISSIIDLLHKNSDHSNSVQCSGCPNNWATVP